MRDGRAFGGRWLVVEMVGGGGGGWWVVGGTVDRYRCVLILGSSSL